MADTVKVSADELAGLAAKLDALSDQLSDGERMLLIALFDAAGRSLADEPSEVEGYIGLLLPAVQAARGAAGASSGLGTAFLGALPGSSSGDRPTESISLNFSKIE